MFDRSTRLDQLDHVEVGFAAQIGVVVNALQTKAEQAQEFRLVALVIGQFIDVVVVQLLPDGTTGFLHFVAQFPVIQTQAVFFAVSGAAPLYSLVANRRWICSMQPS